MKLRSPKGWFLSGLLIGIGLADIFRDGLLGLALFVGGLGGRWLLGKIASVFFDDELAVIKSGWRHGSAGHEGRFSECQDPLCWP